MKYVNIKGWCEGIVPFISESINDVTGRIVYAFPEQPNMDQLGHASSHYQWTEWHCNKYPDMFKAEYITDKHGFIERVVNYYQGGIN